MSRARLTTWVALVLVGGLVCWFFPLFHIRTLDATTKSDVSFQHASTTSPATGEPRKLEDDSVDATRKLEAYATGEPRKLEAYATGTGIVQLWNAFDADANGARRQFGRQAGLGGAWYFCVQGQGTVETVEKDRVILSVADRSRRVCLELGVVVDNTVREAIGVKASDFANSQDFNAVSSELNRRVEQEVIAPNRALLKQGVVVAFVGCAKIGGKSDLDPLCLIPIQLQVRDERGVSSRGVSFQLANPRKNSYSGKLEAYPTGVTP